MPTYEEVLHLVQRLPPNEQARLLEVLKSLAKRPLEVEDTTETIPFEELEESENALQDYRRGSDTGLSSSALKLKLFGQSVG